LRARSFQPLDGGADVDARVFRVDADGGRAYFLKVRRAAGAASVAVPHYLASLGLRQVLAPIPTQGGDLVAPLRGYSLILYPFQPGQNAMQAGLTPAQWTELGTVIKAVHSASLPERLLPLIPRETFSPKYRSQAAGYLQRALLGAYDDSPGRGLAAVLRSRQGEIEFMLGRASALAEPLARRPPPFVLCHADLHRWNIQVGPDGALLIVDWDSLRLAPKECDLMFIGGNIGGDTGFAAEQESFYRGYGREPINRAALAYYRYERILVDIAEYSQQVWDRPGLTPGACDQIIRNVLGNFLPGNELDGARRADGDISCHNGVSADS
jgi:spectinomycin phosphotransferase